MSHPLRQVLRRIIPGLVALFLLAGPASAGSDPFDAVPASHWAYPALEALWDEGLLPSEPPAPGQAGLTRYEVAGLVSQAEQALASTTPGGSGSSQAEALLARLYLSAEDLGKAWHGAGHAGSASLLDRLQAGRQLYWLVPATDRLARAYRAASREEGSGALAPMARGAESLHERLLRQLPPSLAALSQPDVDRLELALVDRFAADTPSPAELAERVGRTRQALLELRSGFGSELQTLGLDRQSTLDLPAPTPADRVTLDDLRRATWSGNLEPPSGGAGIGTQLPLGSGGTLEARIGLDRAPGEASARPAVGLGLGLGETQLHASWRLLDFSAERPGRTEGEAGLDLRF